MTYKIRVTIEDERQGANAITLATAGEVAQLVAILERAKAWLVTQTTNVRSIP